MRATACIWLIENVLGVCKPVPMTGSCSSFKEIRDLPPAKKDNCPLKRQALEPLSPVHALIKLSQTIPITSLEEFGDLVFRFGD